jgi:hypothetical protein
MCGRRGAYRVLVGKREGKITLGITSIRWEDSIKMHLQEVGCGVWTVLIWLRIWTGCEVLWCANKPWGSIKCGEFLLICVERNNQERILQFEVVAMDVLALLVSSALVWGIRGVTVELRQGPQKSRYAPVKSHIVR